MFPTCCDEFVIDGRMHLTVIDIENIDASLLLALNENFVDICEGSSGTDIATVKRRVCEIDHSFILTFGFLCKLRCAAPGVGDVCHNEIRLPQHPAVAPRNRKARVHRLNALR